ncbi:MAG: GNAT family N-acetyltransferase [Gammaproteobacteria bacterium]|nr:GNAT family N-acetyltransferase [Gammaproteobacteria bacterium]
MQAQSHNDAWTLQRSDEVDIDVLMGWFDTEAEVITWGGPKFRFPYTRESFRKDCHWPEMASFSLRDPSEQLCAFGQMYDRNGRINLARLVVRPDRRGNGIGRQLVTMLMSVGPTLLPLGEFSLFVFRDNLPALKCYRSLGFEIQEYPADQILSDQCYYLTRPVKVQPK